MTMSSDNTPLDNLHFPCDPHTANDYDAPSSANSRLETVRNLEDYFSFLEDIAPADDIGSKENVITDRPFTL
jgi:hypothetical protein